ncbi:gluconate 2-dehydrogenase (acceptor) [Nitratireductor indicus C115]|uniref:Gluconate 2-dehydrogenase (Acceptor) n=1 Tax=Nitratireductor indicus C115 TaxID=1231190 RepID=K2NP17_9HYPH|nr:cytochrome c [Nitratireductor indicus]EKF41110.1 gluconate 2-dehydrogenase (acceptor) [Nitratireductor indicus C115]SFQ74483.1 Cytochrome c, mono-and diheme variants [Nitratireductor indicus]
MKTLLKIIGLLVLLGLVAVAAIAFVPIRATPPQGQVAADFKPAEGQGEYAMRLADCAACHTAEGGKPFAGGRPIESPFGTIWSTNITPDPETGIGGYTLDEFRHVLYDGVRRDGAHLYPAMPYENYRMASEEDVRALYDYFMNGVEPVKSEVKKTALDFPFNQRWGIRVWDWVGLASPGFKPRYNNPVLNRGAYIVETLGHCGACHSPRTPIFAQDGTDGTSDGFLRGGEIAGWSAPDLRGAKSAPQLWSASQLKAYLASGRNNHSAVTGEMSLVVQDSLQYLTNEDLDAVVAYLRHIGDGDGGKEELPASGEKPAPDATTALLNSADPSMDLGPRLYLDNCGACHFTNGKGADGVFPELDGNSLVTADQVTGLLHVILNGSRLPSTRERPADLAMPGFGKRLSDEEVAALATFLRGAWSNKAGPVDTATVAANRSGS